MEPDIQQRFIPLPLTYDKQLGATSRCQQQRQSVTQCAEQSLCAFYIPAFQLGTFSQLSVAQQDFNPLNDRPLRSSVTYLSSVTLLWWM